MAHYQQTVDDIRSLLASVDQTNTPEVTEWAAAYAQACREANERLRRCGDYLRQGLRSEAIHLAEAPPNLLDMVAALDMVELPDWENLCAAYELPRAPRLLLDVAAELNEAYAIEQPLQSLLRRHRLLALARAPLHKRLEVMRELALQDPGAPFWDEDIRTFETARLRELHLEGTAAVKARNLATVERLLEETRPEHWRTEVPAELRSGLERARRVFRQEQGIAHLRSMLPKLDLAYSAMSYTECNQLLRQWQKIAQENGLHVPGDLLEQVQPIFDWVREQTQRRETERQMQLACNQLDEALDRDASSEELARLLRAAGGYGMPIPDELQRRTAVALKERELARTRKMRRNVAIGAVAVLLIAMGTGYLIWQSIENRQAETWQRQIAGLLAEEKLTEAEAAWQRMVASVPHFAQRGELLDVRQKLTNAQEAESARASRFQAAVETAMAAGFDQPDMRAIAAAEQAAKTQEEKLQVYELKAKVDLARKAAAEQREEAFRKDMATLADLVRTIETAHSEQDDEAVATKLAEAQQLASKLNVAAVNVSSGSRLAFHAVEARLNAVRRSLSALALEREQLDLMVRAAATSEGLVRAIAAYRSTLPDTPRAEELADALAQEPAWKAMEAWNDLVRQWRGEMRPNGATALATRFKAVDAYLKAHPRTPIHAQATAYREYLERGSRVLGAEDPWRRSLENLLANPFVADLKCIQAPDGKVYYVLRESNYREDSVGATFDAIVSNNLDRPVPQTLRGQKGLQVVPSPQSVMANKLSGQLLRVPPEQWEDYGLQLLQVVRDQKDLDPILAVIFTDHLLRLTQEYGWRPDYSSTLRSIRELRADDVAWMDPNDEVAMRVRQRAALVLGALPKPEEMKAELENQKRQTLEGAAVQVLATGVLLRNGEQWQAGCHTVPEGDSVLYATLPAADEGQPARLVAVGSCDGKSIKLDQAVVRPMPQGTMLFFCRSRLN